MFTILYRIVAYDSCDHRSSTHDERIIGLFPTLQEAKEAVLHMAQPIFDRAYKVSLENIPEEVRNLQGPGIFEPFLVLPHMDDGEVGVSVDHLPSPQEASHYQAEFITHHFMIKEIETAF